MVKKKPNREWLYIETYDFQHSIEKDVVFLTLFIVFLKKHFFYTKIAKYWKMGIRCSFEWRKFPLSSLFISRSPLGQQWLLLLALPLLKKQKTLWPLRPVQGGVGSNPTTATTRWIIEFFFQKSKKHLHPFPIYSRQKSLKEITWGQIISTKTEFQLANGCIKEYMARNILFSPLGHVAFDSLVGRTVSFWRKGWRIAPTACDFFSIQLLPLFP